MLGLLLLSLLLLALSACPRAPRVIEPARLNQEILRLTNALRAEQGVPALSGLNELDELALQHSQNMANANFFDHTDPEGRGPADRMRLYLPGLLSVSSGENIAVRSIDGEDETTMAETLIKMWRESPGHYKNMISQEYWHLGVATVIAGDKLYATQSFAAGVALSEAALPASVPAGRPLDLNFRYLATFPKSELRAFMYAPNPAARIPAGNGSAYIGKGPLRIDWRDESHFSLHVATDFGLGACRLLLGHGENYYNSPIQFQVVSPTI